MNRAFFLYIKHNELIHTRCTHIQRLSVMQCKQKEKKKKLKKNKENEWLINTDVMTWEHEKKHFKALKCILILLQYLHGMFAPIRLIKSNYLFNALKSKYFISCSSKKKTKKYFESLLFFSFSSFNNSTSLAFKVEIQMKNNNNKKKITFLKCQVITHWMAGRQAGNANKTIFFLSHHAERWIEIIKM